ncbi:carnosine N-methyltransferase [Contarinia nasturtii]|uniref:carnosine N-methyltransferase n=1 Tax=Contarinia nasturtii TaxID=265458 RepID=UPI0012D463B6|nr:carnosine N-methyltransferase [Contarinia nasturtii]
MDHLADRHFENYSHEDAEEERRNFLSVLKAFRYYRTHSMNRVDKTESYLSTLPLAHQGMMLKYRDHLFRIRNCIDENFQIIRKLVEDVGNLFENANQAMVPKSHNNRYEDDDIRVRLQDMDKVQVTLKQFARDWSADGEEERQQCYAPIINEIEKFYNADKIDISKIRILVPGAGLGRLTYELAYRGYYCEGNEFSLFMLVASNFVLNKCIVENQYTIYPYVHQYVNNLHRKDQVIPVQFPDVSPTKAKPKGGFNMVAGDFLQVYNTSNYWDCVATCFFIDCANNIIEFVETIYKILRPGAIWVNLGPLLYHYSDVSGEGSIEPSYEDLLLIIRGVGFTILKNETGMKTKYAQNPRSMQQSEYLSVFFVCQKPILMDDEYHNGNDKPNDLNGHGHH